MNCFAWETVTQKIAESHGWHVTYDMMLPVCALDLSPLKYVFLMKCSSHEMLLYIIYVFLCMKYIYIYSRTNFGQENQRWWVEDDFKFHWLGWLCGRATHVMNIRGRHFDDCIEKKVKSTALRRCVIIRFSENCSIYIVYRHNLVSSN